MIHSRDFAEKVNSLNSNILYNGLIAICIDRCKPADFNELGCFSPATLLVNSEISYASTFCMWCGVTKESFDRSVRILLPKIAKDENTRVSIWYNTFYDNYSCAFLFLLPLLAIATNDLNLHGTSFGGALDCSLGILQ